MDDRTTVLTGRIAAPTDEDTGHYLTVVDGKDPGRRFELTDRLATIGRVEPCEIVLADTEISRRHCSVGVFRGEAIVVDEKSTNGTFVQGRRVASATPLAHGELLQIGRHVLKYERRSRREVAAADEVNRDLAKARRYVESMLPPPLADGPVTTDWIYLPSAHLGGDAFGSQRQTDGSIELYLVDVSGHGAEAAMHAVAVLNALRRHALPGTDFRRPADVLSRLNTMFAMADHGSMYFTIWYGCYDPSTRMLEYSSGGHHPAFLRGAAGGRLVPLRTPAPAIGIADTPVFRSERIEVPPGSALYLFSDGVFEVVTREGADWSLAEFTALIERGPFAGAGEPRRLLDAVRSIARPGGFDDDFSLLVASFR